MDASNISTGTEPTITEKETQQMTQTTIPYTWTGNTLSFTDLRDGDQHVVPNTHVNYTRIKNAVQNDDIETAVNLFNLKESVAAQSNGAVTIEGETVFYKGLPVTNTISDMIVKMIREGLDFQPLANFLAKILENPSYRSREQLHGFIEKYLFSITPDGDFLAYRVVTNDWKDKHTRTMDNSVGTVVEMPREDVDEDPNRTCSAGLHVCGRSYVSSFKYGDDRLTLVSVNPRDVVAIPTDYDHAKMRVCRFKVLGEIGENFNEEEMSPVARQRKVQVRDAKGRFTSQMAFEPIPTTELDTNW